MSMMYDVRELLKTWELSQLIPLFEEQQITVQALSALSKEDVKELIPQTGPRVLFTRCWSMWKNEFSQTGCSESNNDISSLSLMIDFEEHYKDHANNLFSYFLVIKFKIIDCFKKQTFPSRDTICQEIINLADSSNIEDQNLAALLAFAYLLNTSNIKVKNKKGKTQSGCSWKPSQAEARDAFIKHIYTDAEIHETIGTRLKYLKTKGVTHYTQVLIA